MKQLKEGLSAQDCTWQLYSTWYDTKAVLAERGWTWQPCRSILSERRSIILWEKGFNLVTTCIFHRGFLKKGHLISLSIFEKSEIYLRAKCLQYKGKPELDSKDLRTISRAVMWTRPLHSGSYFWLWHCVILDKSSLLSSSHLSSHSLPHLVG